MSLLFELFVTFFKIGLFTFGGGYAMLPLVENAVITNKWMTLDELVNFIAVSESTPGPFAVNTATFVGMSTSGIKGALTATLGVVLPSFIVILIVAHYFNQFRNAKVVKGMMKGLRPTVVGMIGYAIVSLASTIFLNGSNILQALYNIKTYLALAIFLVMTLLSFKKVHPILIIIISGCLGIFIGMVL